MIISPKTYLPCQLFSCRIRGVISSCLFFFISRQHTVFYAFSIQKGKRKNHYYRYKQRKVSLLRSRINVLSTKQILRGIQNWTTNGFLKIPPSTDSRGKKRKSILDFKGSLKILSKITQCNGKITKHISGVYIFVELQAAAQVASMFCSECLNI